MMKRFSALLLILVLLAGCSAQTRTAGTDASQQTGSTVPSGLYDPCSTQEAETGGALRCYPLSGTRYSILPVDTGLLLFSESETSTVISKLEGSEAVPTVSLELPFSLSALDNSVQPCNGGFSCFDPVGAETWILSENLEVRSRIRAPEDLTGSPILSSDGTALYYCTASSVRALDLQTGISRILMQTGERGQTVSGLLLSDSVVQCTLTDSDRQETLFLSAENGNTLFLSETFCQAVTASQTYYAATKDEGQSLWLFGTADNAPQALIFPNTDTVGFFLPERHGAVGLHQPDAGTVTLDYYDLRTGLRTGSLTLSTSHLPGNFCAYDGGIWFLSYDESYGCTTLYRWEPALSAVEDAQVYTSPHYTRNKPDTEGLAACIQYARELGESYGIEILVYQEAVQVQPEDYRLTCEYRVPVIQRELELLAENLRHYPPGFLQTLRERFDGVSICIVGSLTGTSDLSDPGKTGLQFWDGHHAYIALATLTQTDRTLYHGLCHLIDTIVLNECSAYDTWSQLNPSGFAYDYDYIQNRQRNSTAYLQDSSRYFVDMYSMSYPKEDRARIMEYAMTAGNEALFRSDAMQAKLKTLCTGIREAFCLEDSSDVFLWEQYLQTPLARNQE